MTDTSSTSIKPAYKTTEGWMALGTGALGALVTAHFIAEGGTVVTVGGMVMTLVATVMHQWSRTKIKTAGAS